MRLTLVPITIGEAVAFVARHHRHHEEEPRCSRFVLEAAPPSHTPETALCNPPGGLIKELWYSLCSYWARGWISSAVWVGFSVEQLTYLQKTRAPHQPLQLPTCFPRRRLAYRTPSGEIAESPPHASYLTLLTRDPAVYRRFVEAARNLGHVINA